MRFLDGLVDERFLAYRLRASSAAGIAGGCVAIALFGYRYFIDHRWAWDVLAVAMTIVGVKSALMLWHMLRR